MKKESYIAFVNFLKNKLESEFGLKLKKQKRLSKIRLSAEGMEDDIKFFDGEHKAMLYCGQSDLKSEDFVICFQITALKRYELGQFFVLRISYSCERKNILLSYVIIVSDRTFYESFNSEPLDSEIEFKEEEFLGFSRHISQAISSKSRKARSLFL